MPIIFADIFPEVNKLADELETRDHILYGNTYYSFEPIKAGSLYSYLQARAVSQPGIKENTSKLYLEYKSICAIHKQSSELSRHEKSIVRGYYKYVYSKFAEVLEKKDVNIEYITEARNKLNNLATQFKMIETFYKSKLMKYYYIEIDGYKFPLSSSPDSPFTEVGNAIDSVKFDLDQLEKRFDEATNSRKRTRLNHTLESFHEETEKRINYITGLLKISRKQEFMIPIRFENRDVHIMDMNASFDDIKKYAGVDLSPVIRYNGNHINNPLIKTERNNRVSDYGYIGILERDFYNVCVFNNLNVRPDYTNDMTTEVLRKVNDISRIFGLLSIIENRVCQKHYCNQDYVRLVFTYHKRYNLVAIINEIKVEYEKLTATV